MAASAGRGRSPAPRERYAAHRRARLALGALGPCALGAAFGGATSVSNDLASPLEPDSFARLVSLILDAGWAWAALAVAAGVLAGTPGRGAVAGVLALIAATTAYFGTDSILRDEPLSWYRLEIVRWWLVSLVCGPALGAVGAFARRADALGLLAALAVPAGATAQMIVLPPGAGGPTVTPPTNWARGIVLAAAAAGAAAALARFVLAERRRLRAP